MLQLSTLPAAQHLSSQEVSELLALLLTSIKPYDRDVAECTAAFCRLPAAQQLSSQAVIQLLTLLLTWSRHQAVDECMAALCRLPAAQQLTRDYVIQLLQTAAGLAHADCGAELLCSLPAAKHISCFAIASLVRTAVQFHALYRVGQFVKAVCGLPAAQQLAPDTAVELLTYATARCNAYCVLQLCKLQAAQEISSDLVLAFSSCM
jgi:hypothetical protein